MIPKVGDYIRIKSKEHWNIKSYDEIYVDGEKFQAEFNRSLSMEEKLGCVFKVNQVNGYFFGDEDGYSWDYHSIEEILTIETHPEYFL